LTFNCLLSKSEVQYVYIYPTPSFTIIYVCFFFYFPCRDASGKGIANAKISVGRRKTEGMIRPATVTSDHGDYYRLLLKGDYNLTVTAYGKSLTIPVHVDGVPAVIVDFVVNKDSITAQSVHPDNEVPEVTLAVVDVQDGEESKVTTLEYINNNVSSVVDEVKKEVTPNRKVVKSSRSDNVAAAAVIVTIGVIVCVLAGIVLFRKVKDLRSNTNQGGYAKINQEKFESYEP